MDIGRKEITVCTGTTCYVLGAAELIGELEEAIETGRLEGALRGSTCLGYCKKRQNGGAPFVEIDGAPLPQATLEVVKEKRNGSYE